ncbi:YgiT-type zinc finger protein [bacterium]|nr:YgiT-type zinc finger protein [bacterium]
MKRKKTSQERCPMCGQGTTHVEKLDYKLKDENGEEFTVPQLEVEICNFCGEHIFNMAAVRKARAVQGDTGKILLRLQPTLQNALAARARNNKRSLAQEAQHLLETSLGAN